MAKVGSADTVIESMRETRFHTWAQLETEVFGALKSGHRLVSLFGNRGDGGIYLNVLLAMNRKLVLLRSKAEGSYSSWTNEFPQFHCFEREMYEQFGLEPKGHPWLKPVRFSKDTPDAYQFFKMEGKEVHEVGVGPIHAGVIEPGHFRFMCYGETVHHLEIQLGFQHRAVEKLLEGREPLQLAPWMETAAGDTTVAHAWAYCQAVESLCGVEIAEEAGVIRGVALELERIAMHLAGLAGICNDIAYLPASSYYGRLRTAIINTSMLICGSRFSRGWLRPGGVHFGLNAEVRNAVIATLRELKKDLDVINGLVESSVTVRHRLAQMGVVPQAAAHALGLVGVSARASGLRVDLRADLPVAPFDTRPIPAMYETAGDCWSRSRIRMREIEASTEWILAALNERAEWPASQVELTPPPAEHMAVSVVEGWRGEVVHVLETGKAGEIRSYRIQDPSLRNWMAVAQAVRGGSISDFPICNKSFDLSYCGNDL